ncbi:MAG TPA: sigma-70 family RNA polymerase sigma factor [Bacteroidia bacterium]|nr:sigma-70 family RNA polymerase sigma factor [Bacteroidia bacterium]
MGSSMQFNPLTDNELIQQYLKGSDDALRNLIERHKRKIFSTIYLLVKNRDLADDLFQDTFIKVINTLRGGNYQEEGKFLPWVLRIAHNLVIDYFRKQKRMQMVHDTEEYSIMDTLRLTDDNVEDKMVQDQILNQVKLLIDELPEDQRDVVIMRHYKDMSFKEIAETTNVSINTALGRMRYALINLRKIIEDKKLMLEK